jgi:hypothetical protein
VRLRPPPVRPALAACGCALALAAAAGGSATGSAVAGSAVAVAVAGGGAAGSAVAAGGGADGGGAAGSAVAAGGGADGGGATGGAVAGGGAAGSAVAAGGGADGGGATGGAVAGGGAAGSGALAPTSARLRAAFTPYRLGRRTTLQFEFAFSAPAGAVPPPLVEMQLRYPRGINFFLNNLGIERCPERVLEASGPAGCPPNSAIGYGVVETGIVLGDEPVQESSPITILRAPERDGHFALLFFAEGRVPVVTNVIFSGLLLSAREPFGGNVQIGVPLVETLPGAPYVSVLHLHATIGPRHLTYYHDVDGVSLAFAPQGILLPPTCPRASFPFAAIFAFSDGTRALASTTVPCPPGRAARRAPARKPRPNG